MRDQSEFHYDNHYVPRVYLKQFAGADGKIATYQILVAHENVPIWKPHAPGSVGYVSHLYTRMAAGRETDEIERWLDREFEGPATEALRKATSDEPLRRDDWVSLIRFVAAQDVRTPARLLENLERWETTVPVILEDVVEVAVDRLAHAKKQGIDLVSKNSSVGQYIPLRVTAERESGQAMAQVKVEMIAGRGLWFIGMRHLLTHTLTHLEAHKWTILHPPDGLTWFTSDDPVVRLNYYGDGNYDFRGGWAIKVQSLFSRWDLAIFYTRKSASTRHGGVRP